MCCIDLAAQSVAIAIAANSRFDVAMPELTRRDDACDRLSRFRPRNHTS